MQKSDIKKLLDQGRLVFIELIDQPEALSAFNIGLVERKWLEAIPEEMRSVALSDLLCYINVSQAMVDKKDDAPSFVSQMEGGMSQEESMNRAVGTLRILEEAWPLDAAFVRSCVHGEATAYLAMTPVFGLQLQDQGPLLPEGFAGFIWRTHSRASYWPKETA